LIRPAPIWESPRSSQEERVDGTSGHDAAMGRRQLLQGGALLALGLALGPRRALAEAALARRLRMRHAHTGESLDLVFHDGAAPVPGAQAELDRFLRDHYTGEVHPIDPLVLDIAWGVARAAGCDGAPLEIVCGYRSPATNARLHARSPRGVASRSLHLTGRAIDLRLPGLATSRLRDAALRLRQGGVGFYAGQDFVHLDSGRPRAW
jgi:uncharacterized protein YcbK (DUF882 family)